MTQLVAAPPRPVPLIVCAEGIPDDLKAGRRLVNWRYEFRPGRSKPWTKPPINPHASADSPYASVDDPQSWSTFEEVTRAMERFDGVGRVLVEGEKFLGRPGQGEFIKRGACPAI